MIIIIDKDGYLIEFLKPYRYDMMDDNNVYLKIAPDETIEIIDERKKKRKAIKNKTFR